MSTERNTAVQRYSCIRCFNRKVKCDKGVPCSLCIRQEAVCEYRPARQAKKRRLGTDSPTGRQQAQHRPQTVDDAANQGVTPSTRLSSESLYAPNIPSSKSGPWQSVSEAMKAAAVSSDDSDDALVADAGTSMDFLMSPESSQIEACTHPRPEVTWTLWKMYKQNVEPLVKLLHVPTVESQIREIGDGSASLSSEFSVLLFAIYASAIYSLSDAQCHEHFREGKTQLLARYRSATTTSLGRIRYLSTSSLVVLQALCLYLLTMRTVSDGKTYWIMTGIAVRIAQGMKLDKDGTFRGLSPFETEINRRVWFFLKLTDSRSAEFAGAEKFQLFGVTPTSTKDPLNINDTDIWPSMLQLPTPSPKITDTSFNTLRSEFAGFWKTSLRKEEFEASELAKAEQDMSGLNDARLDQLEEHLRDTYTKYCTPTYPFHLFLSFVSTGAVQRLRFMANHPRHWTDSVTQKERDYARDLSLSLLEGFVSCHQNSALAGYRWHMFYSFPWHPMIHLLDYLSYSPEDCRQEEAWETVKNIYETHPHFLTENKRPVHIAIGKLVLDAYDARLKSAMPMREVPGYLRTLLAQRERRQMRQQRRRTSGSIQSPDMLTPSTLPTSVSDLQWTDIDWQEWTKLLAEWESNIDT